MPKKARVNTRPTADFYAADGEKIIEFTFPDGTGGLIAFIVTEFGNRVNVYRTDPGVTVVGPREETVT